MKKVLHVNSKFKANASNTSEREFFGAKHIVIEGVSSMIADTVMNGIMYKREQVEELAARTSENIHSPAAHPQDKEGNFILAGTPQAVMQNYIGAFSFNYRMKGDRLVHDLAINPEIANRSEDGREVLRRISANEAIDTSTGLLIYSMSEETGYGACGTRYDLLAHEIELDHDAILIHERGAATNLQGVGVFANSKNEKVEVDTFSTNATIANETLDILDVPFDEPAALERIKAYTNSGNEPSSNFRRFFLYFDRKNPGAYDSYEFPFADIIDGKPVAIKQALEKAAEQMANSQDAEQYAGGLEIAQRYLKRQRDLIANRDAGFFKSVWNKIKRAFIGNDIGHRDLEDLIYSKINEGRDSDDNHAYPVDIFDDYFIYEDGLANLLKVGYNVENGELVLTGSPIKVRRVSTYEPIEEVDPMKETILKALQAAGIDTEGKSETELLAAYVSLKKEVKAANADEAEGDAPASEDDKAEGDDQAAEGEEDKPEVSANSELLQAIQALNSEVAALKANTKTEIAQALESAGVIAVNASNRPAESSVADFDEMPD